MQSSLTSILTEGCGRLQFYCGYAFGGVIVAGYTHAIVTTPRYLPAVARQPRPVVVDNGAYAAWRDGRFLSLSEQVDGISECADRLGSQLLWAILPDVVADAPESLRRSRAALDECGVPRARWLLPVQEGAPFSDFSRFVADHGIGGVFIGGASKLFKRQATRALAGAVPWVHVARISADHELHHAAYYGAHSFDSTTPTYGYTQARAPGKARDWSDSFGRYCEPAQ